MCSWRAGILFFSRASFREMIIGIISSRKLLLWTWGKLLLHPLHEHFGLGQVLLLHKLVLFWFSPQCLQPDLLQTEQPNMFEKSLLSSADSLLTGGHRQRSTPGCSWRFWKWCWTPAHQWNSVPEKKLLDFHLFFPVHIPFQGEYHFSLSTWGNLLKLLCFSKLLKWCTQWGAGKICLGSSSGPMGQTDRPGAGDLWVLMKQRNRQHFHFTKSSCREQVNKSSVCFWKKGFRPFRCVQMLGMYFFIRAVQWMQRSCRMMLLRTFLPMPTF